MQFVEPEVILLAFSTTWSEGFEKLARSVGHAGWKPDSTEHADRLAEVAGKLCYKSFKAGLNPNVKKVREDGEEYIDNILSSGHGSVLEHGSVTFAFMNVSRVFTHELVRHRLCAFSQESLRYVRLTELKAYKPDAFDKHPDAFLSQDLIDTMGETFEYLEDVQKKLAALTNIDDENMSFKIKKQLTSAFRRMAPIGLCTNIIVTTNHRNWRHLLAMRTADGAEEEIRKIFLAVGTHLKELAPHIYQDMSIDAHGCVVFGHGRV